MAKVSIDPLKETVKVGFDVGIGKASISVGPSGPKAEIGVNLGPIGKAGITLGPSGPGVSIGLGPVSIGMGPNSASGFESMVWDFGVARQTTKQVGCTITRETWIVGAGVLESESWTDPKCELPPQEPPLPQPSPQALGKPVINDYIPPGDPACVALISVRAIVLDYFSGIPWWCWVYPHGRDGRDTRASSTAELKIHPEDDANLENFDLSIWPRYRLVGQKNMQVVNTEWSALDSASPWNGTGKRKVTALFKGPITLGHAWNSRISPEITLRNIGINEVSRSFENEITNVGAHTPQEFTFILAYGKASKINEHFNALNKSSANNVSEGHWIERTNGGLEFPLGAGPCTGSRVYIYSLQHTITRFVTRKPTPPKSPPNKPPEPMDKACCAMIKELHEFFQVERIKNKGFEIPNRLQIAGGEGEAKYNNWMQITEALIRISDHLGLHPLSVSVADLRSDIEGNQTFGANFASGTQGIQAAMSHLWLSGGKSDTITAFLYKLSVLTIQMMLLNCKQSGDLQALKDMIGGSTKPSVETVRTPLNIAAGVKDSSKKNRGKGFGKEKGQSKQPIAESVPEFDPAMADPNTLFPEFLKNRDNEISIEQFDGDKDIYDLLTLIILKIEKLEYRG